ncbi:MAG: hypothetical protein ACQKBU_09035 [Verrucomicrobiales bacterium]
MRHLLPLFFLLPVAAHDLEDSDDELIYGIEVLTGYRSEYVDRGFKLANQLLEVQVGAEIALSNQWLIDFGGWYGSETGSGDFDQTSLFFGTHYEGEQWQTGLQLAYNRYSNLLFRDGVQVGPYFDQLMGEDWRLGAAIEYDSGAKGWYGKLEAEWSQPTGEHSYLALIGGLSATSDFYGNSGWNDGFARFSWSYHLNRHVTLTPFVGTSVALDSARETRLFGGLWFAVNF